MAGECVVNLIFRDDGRIQFAAKFEKLVDDIRLLPQSKKHIGELKPHQILNVQFRDQVILENGERGESEIVRVKMRLDNYYLNGYQRVDDRNGSYTDGHELYEFKDKNEKPGVHTLKGSTLMLGTSVTYPDKLTDMNMGLVKFEAAVRGLARKQEVVKNFLTIALHMSESIRFRWFSMHNVTMFRRGEEWLFQQWMDKMVHNWGGLSDRARRYAKDMNIDVNDLSIQSLPSDEEYIIRYKYQAFTLADGDRAAAVCVMKLTPS